jgi:two-component system nitrogen regulation response regulator GlnG
MPFVLVIDDDRAIRRLIEKALEEVNADVLAAATAEEGLELLRQHRPDVVLLDIMLPTTSGLDVFEQIREVDSKLPIVFITSMASSETAIKAMTMGAFDYLLKPLELEKVQLLVRQALEIRRLMHVPVDFPTAANGNRSDGPGRATPVHGESLVGSTPQMQEVYKAIGRVAQQDVTVLIRGESGTGKELVARAVYQHSPRASGPFLAVNCAAIPEALLESELFGHEKGSFTGADQRRIGKFEQCHGGTLFLDEIGDMSPMVQSKVLRVLQEKEFERVGGNQTIRSDVRVIAATHRALEEMVEEGEFRNDLYYRLSGYTINLPPLRERRDDLVPLIDNFLAAFNKELQKDVHGFSPEALDVLMSYSWPGNVRELQNVLKQTLLRSAGPVVLPDFLPDRLRSPSSPAAGQHGGDAIDTDLRPFVDERLQANSQDVYAETLEFMERFLITRILAECDGNQSQAARILGITRGSLRTKIRSLNVSIDRMVQIEGEPCET